MSPASWMPCFPAPWQRELCRGWVSSWRTVSSTAATRLHCCGRRDAVAPPGIATTSMHWYNAMCANWPASTRWTYCQNCSGWRRRRPRGYSICQLSGRNFGRACRPYATISRCSNGSSWCSDCRRGTAIGLAVWSRRRNCTSPTRAWPRHFSAWMHRPWRPTVNCSASSSRRSFSRNCNAKRRAMNSG